MTPIRSVRASGLPMLRDVFAVPLVLTLAACLSAHDLSAQSGAPTAPIDREGVPVAPVVIDGEVLFSVRGLSAYPAERRAAEIAARIRAFAEDASIAANSMLLADRPSETLIVLARREVMRVHDEDAAVEAVERHVLAEAYRARIAGAIDAYRAAREPARLWRHTLLALGATLLLFAAAFVGERAFRWLRKRVERRYSGLVRDVSIQSFRVFRAEQLWWVLGGILRLVWGVAFVAMVFVYLHYTLQLFPWTLPTARGLVAIAVDPLKRMALGIIGMIPDLVFLAILFLLTRYLLSLVRLFFDSVGKGRVELQGFDREWAGPTYRAVRLAVIAFALVVAYPYVPGSQTDAFKGITVFLGIVFSLGSSSLIGNVISGYSMTYRRTFRVGDRVKIGEHIGAVIEMRLLGTHLRTPRNEVVVVPNSVIVATDVVNYSTMAKQDGLILSATVGIGYETPWRQVEAMLLEAAARTPGLLAAPPPFVHHTALGDFSVTYEVNVYCDAPERMRFLYTALRRSILDVFNEYGVQIMTPAYEGDPEQPKVVPKDRWFTEPASPGSGEKPARRTPPAT